jgi:hypothetical protein
LFELQGLVTAYERTGAATTGSSVGPAVLAFIHNLKLDAAAFTHVNLALFHLVAVRHCSILLNLAWFPITPFSIFLHYTL